MFYYFFGLSFQKTPLKYKNCVKTKSGSLFSLMYPLMEHSRTAKGEGKANLIHMGL